MARRRPPSADPLADLTAAVVAATEELVRRDPVLARLVAAFGPCDLAGRRDLSHFGALCRSITFQQLAGRAAGTIFRRFVPAATGGGGGGAPAPGGGLVPAPGGVRLGAGGAPETGGSRTGRRPRLCRRKRRPRNRHRRSPRRGSVRRSGPRLPGDAHRDPSPRPDPAPAGGPARG